MEYPLKDVDSDAEAAYDERVRHIMDTQGLSYNDAEMIAGPTPYEKAEVTPSSEVPVQRKVGSGAVHASHDRKNNGSSRGPVSEDESIGYDNNLPHYYQSPPQFTEEAAANHHAHVAAIRQMLADKKQAKSQE